MTGSDARPYQRIEDYALLGNCRGSALVARDGSIDWASLERFDAEPVFSRLLDRNRGGYFTIQPDEPFESRRIYLASTNILETTFTTQSGVLCLHDFMLAPEGGHPTLVRLVTGVSGAVPVVAIYRPLAGFADSFADLVISEGRVTGEGLPCLVSEARFELEHGCAVTRFTLGGLEDCSFALFEAGAGSFEALPARELMETARRAWVGWAAGAAYDGPLSDELIRSALTLKALTYEPSGAIVAAATTSLPEEIGGVRNWDYRFCWIRDACLSFYVLKKFGMVAEAEAFFGFVCTLSDREGGGLKPLYGVGGETRLTEREIAHFEGWRGSSPVNHGNLAAEQHQSDAYGQVLDLFYLYHRLGGTISEAAQAQAIQLADFSARHWHEKDAGLWEPRKPEEHYLHAAIMNWVALDRAIRLFGERPDWCAERDRIVARVNGEGIHAEGYYPQFLGSDDVDAALLIAPMVGFPVDETAFAKTVDVIVERLGHGPLVYRYRNDDGLPGHEGTFLICAFWLVDALAWLGRIEEAQTRFTALRALQNDVGLYAEEIDERDNSFLGNFPQAFSHLAFVHSALVLDLATHGGREAVKGTYADRTLRETAARRVPTM
ncbi:MULTISPECIES: glycoside hydrolase family 15 protein [Methylobacterium]|uniref:Trehalase n=1 Tax=Methylobacterium thuringiense TaxID=1003091 RepID=A0ABQ4TN87_9HYPH|nr:MULTISPECIES: glycoside hydrolase family 15 protein [Methylobacterium]TXN24685.1 glycoside hydrolase family 15 protein [Methylobacterium sp. WL9]GJE56848.1 Trehalase [Methylobacterium thuringiense]